MTRILFTFSLIVSLFFAGCGIYSFRGGKLPENLKTVSVETFDNNALVVVPSLAVDLSEKLRDKFISQSNLRLVGYEGDAQFSGAITTYNVTPVAIQGNDQAASNRLTIAVNVKYDCVPNPESSWTKTFSQFADFPGTQSLSDVEGELITDIVDRLTTDIFNKVLGDW